MNTRSVLAVLIFSLLLPISGFSSEFSGRNHATAMLLLSDSDQSVKLAGKSLYWFGSDERKLLDVFGEVVWSACSGKRQMDADALAWLAKAIARTTQSRYAGLLDYCLSMPIDERTKSHITLARQELMSLPLEPFEGGHVDLAKIRAGLVQPHLFKQNRLGESFAALSKGMTLAEVYSMLGYPDEVGVATTSPANKSNPRARLAALAITYKEVGTIHFFSEEEQPDWKLDNAMSSKGMLLSSHDGRFADTGDLIAHGNAAQLSEVADYLLTRKVLESHIFDAIVDRVNTPVDSMDRGLENALAWLGKVVFQSGNADYEKKLVLSLLAHGNGSQLRRVADHLLEKDQIENDVLDAAIARISASRDTQDGYLADGLAWLCKVILKSGQVKYSEMMADLSQTAGHKTLRRYARQAAEGLNS